MHVSKLSANKFERSPHFIDVRTKVYSDAGNAPHKQNEASQPSHAAVLYFRPITARISAEACYA